MNNHFLTLFFFAIALTSCNPDLPSRSLIYGNWKVVNIEESAPCNDLYYTVVLKTTDCFYFKGIKVTCWSSWGGYAIAPSPKNYSMRAQKDGTWLLKIEGLFGWPTHEWEVASPIIIRNLTSKNMEWEYQIPIADSTLVVHYDLEKAN